MRATLYILLVVLYVVHNDLWLWNDARVVGGLPVGLIYHLLFCLTVVGVMSLLVSRVWPQHLDELDAEGSGAGEDASAGGGGERP